jgi:hypothetical protein
MSMGFRLFTISNIRIVVLWGLRHAFLYVGNILRRNMLPRPREFRSRYQNGSWILIRKLGCNYKSNLTLLFVDFSATQFSYKRTGTYSQFPSPSLRLHIFSLLKQHTFSDLGKATLGTRKSWIRLLKKSEWKDLIKRCSYDWDDNSKIALEKVKSDDTDFI